ncbi:hypothetical protein CNMCM8927_002051 [Aspergillus lentulus]|uniref:F-box domain-containing protein n=1 Tax=Aspergillus lentulus TaxID=293939 RepID=A0AAN5YHE3_ASPLE|nr:hypothetical protein CNMCM8927_002051 [Aspergillus lentulus]
MSVPRPEERPFASYYTDAFTMSPLETLPDELLLLIASFAMSQSTIAALVRASHRLYSIYDPCLYRWNVVHGHCSALYWAAEHGNMATFQKALDAGAPLSIERPRGELRKGPVVFRFGRERELHFRDFRPHPLSLAAKGGHEAIVRFIIEKGASPDMADPERFTLLSLAAIHGHVSLTRALIALGARQNIPSFMGHHPLALASYQGHEEIAAILLSDLKNHYKTVFDDQIKEALVSAVTGRRKGIVQLLILHDREEADVNVQGPGWPINGYGVIYSHVLFWPVVQQHEAMVNTLLERGADADIVDLLMNFEPFLPHFLTTVDFRLQRPVFNMDNGGIAFNGYTALTGWDTYSSRNQDDRTTAHLIRQGMTPPKQLSRALYIPRHDGEVSQITLYDISAQYTSATDGILIGSSEYVVALGLMQKPRNEGSNGASVVYDVTFRKQGEEVAGSVRYQGVAGEQPPEQSVEVELAIASADDTAGFLTSKDSASMGSAGAETTRVSMSYPTVPSELRNAPHQAPLPYFQVKVAAETSTWEWQTHAHHHGRLRYTLVRLPVQDQSADACGDEVLAIYNHVGVGASVSLPYSEGVLLLPPRTDPRMEAMVVASLLTMLWRLRDLSGGAGGKRGAGVAETMKKRVDSLKGFLGRKV